MSRKNAFDSEKKEKSFRWEISTKVKKQKKEGANLFREINVTQFK